jgi:peptide chain release factor subunit 1
MLAESDLRELVAFTTGNDPVLSVYLNTEPSKGNSDVCKLRLRNMLKAINLPEDVSAIERYINLEYNWSGRSVAIFSSDRRNFFKTFVLALPVQDSYHVGDRPSVQPLVDLFDNYGGYGVALVDKQGARLFYFHIGELREQEAVEGDSVKHIKTGAASSLTGRRGGAAELKNSVNETVERNMREAVDSAVHFFEEKHVRRVVLGGTDENIALFRSLLPKAWQSLVVGSFAIAKNVPQNEILQKTLQIGLEAEKQKEEGMINNLITRSAKKEGAVIGLEETLKAINAGRVQSLVLVENFHLVGYRCESCGHLTSTPRKECNDCGGPIFKYPDVIELAISAVMHNGGDVQITHPYPAFVDAGCSGAILRY